MNRLYKKRLKTSNVYYSIIPDKNYYSKDNYLSLDYDGLINIVKNNMNADMSYIDITDTLSLEDYYYTDIHWKQENLFKTVDKFSKTMNFKTGKSYKKNVYDTFYGSYYGQLGLNLEPDKLTFLTNDVINNSLVEDISSDLKTVYEISSLGSIDSYDVFLGGATPIVTVTNSNAINSRELIIFRDSFGSSIAPLFLEGYSKITLVDLRYIDESLLSDYMDFQNKDILLLYNTTIINNSDLIKI